MATNMKQIVYVLYKPIIDCVGHIIAYQFEVVSARHTDFGLLAPKLKEDDNRAEHEKRRRHDCEYGLLEKQSKVEAAITTASGERAKCIVARRKCRSAQHGLSGVIVAQRRCPVGGELLQHDVLNCPVNLCEAQLGEARKLAARQNDGRPRTLLVQTGHATLGMVESSTDQAEGRCGWFTR